MKSFRSLLLGGSILAASLAPALAAPETYEIDPVHSQVGFTIRHFVSRVAGHFAKFSGQITVDQETPAVSKVTAEIETASIDTGVDKRNGHLKSPDFFDAEKNPKITFTSTSVVPNGKDHTKVTGDLTMHGVTKPVTLDVAWLGFMGPRAGFQATGTINRKDFGIVYNTVLDAGGTMLGDDVEITILVEADNPGPPKAEEKKPAAPK